MEINLKKHFPRSSFYVRTKSGERKLIDKLEKNDIVEHIKLGKFGKYLKIREILQIDKDWVYISELLRTDGHITKNLVEIKLTNKNRKLLNIFESFCKSLGVEYIRKDKEASYYRYRVFNKTLAKILVKIFGIEGGNKSLTTKLPKWMKQLDNNLTSYLLGGAFDGDGGLQFSKTTKRLRYSTGSLEYAKDLQKMLGKFNIKSTLFKDPRKRKNVYYVQISKRVDLTEFYKNVKFFHDEKKNKLEQMLGAYKNLFLHETELKIKEIVKNRKDIYITTLSKKLGKRVSTVSEQVIKLEKMGKLKTKVVGNKKIVYLPN